MYRWLTFYLIACLFGNQNLLAHEDPPGHRSETVTLARAPHVAAPGDYLGFELGSRAITHDQLSSYFWHLAKGSDRAEYVNYGVTPEGHQLFYLRISDEKNLANLDEIQEKIDRVKSGSPDWESLISTLPAVVWMGSGIHGNELSTSDAAVKVAHQLISSETAQVQNLRANLVVYIDPMYNPDGRERTLARIRAFKRQVATTDPQDIAHTESWPSGRGNHYLFDLNRDALYQIQDQSRQRVKAILEAGPLLYTASHETEWYDNYLFAVPAEPLNPLLPDDVHTSWKEFADDHGAAFDERGISYYTRSWNEVFFPGYYDILPAYFGAVPMLYEQPGTNAQSVLLPSGKIRDFRSAISNHFTSSMANLITASRNKKDLYRRWARVQQSRDRIRSPVASWLILPENKYTTREALRILTSLGIRVSRLKAGIEAKNLHSYWNGRSERVDLPAGTLKIDVQQPMGRVASNLLDFHVQASKAFLEREKRKLDLGQTTQLYDVTAWSLPLAFNNTTYWSPEVVKGSWEEAAFTEPSSRRVVDVQEAGYGYLYQDDSLHATARLLALGVKIRVGQERFEHGGTAYEAGTFLIRNEEQSSPVLAYLLREQIAGEITPISVDSALVDGIGPDLGDPDFYLLREPKIAVLGGEGISSTSFGSLWHLFDASIRVPATLLDLHRLSLANLSSYNTIIVPETLQGKAVKVQLEQGPLSSWVENGGTLITIGSSSLSMAGSTLSSLLRRSEVIESYPPLMAGRTASQVMSNDFKGFASEHTSSLDILPPVITNAARAFVPEEQTGFQLVNELKPFNDWVDGLGIPRSESTALARDVTRYLPHGAYLRVDIRPNHWLSFGVGDKVPVLFREGDVLISTHRSSVVARYSTVGQLMMSGLVWPEAVGYIAGTTYLDVQKQNKGMVISFANDPTFRGYSLGTARLLKNAVFLTKNDL